MASIAGLSKLGLPRLSSRMDPEDARGDTKLFCIRCRNSNAVRIEQHRHREPFGGGCAAALEGTDAGAE